MIFKVFYQEDREQVPVRENTKSLYVEAESERQVRASLKERNYNIEYVQRLEGEHLEYEKASTEFEIEQV